LSQNDKKELGLNIKAQGYVSDVDQSTNI